MSIDEGSGYALLVVEKRATIIGMLVGTCVSGITLPRPSDDDGMVNSTNQADYRMSLMRTGFLIWSVVH